MYLPGAMTKRVHRIFVQMQNSLSEQQYPVVAGWVMQLLQPDDFLYEEPALQQLHSRVNACSLCAPVPTAVSRPGLGKQMLP